MSRVFPNKFGKLLLSDGSYGEDMRGVWWMRPPNADARKLAPADVVRGHDHTITVSGYLLDGNWRKK